MANEKILNTRLQLKYDTYANWTSANPVLKAGEMAVATVPSGTTGTGMANLPNIVLKVGDGVSAYNDLKFVSALAADVYDWAKASSKPEYSYSEIEGLEEYIRSTANDEIENTDTQYTIVAVSGETYKFELRSKGLDDTAWTKVADIDLTEVGTRLTALETLVGTTAVATQITDAIGALNADEVKAGTGEILEAVSEASGIVTVTKRSLVAADIPTIAQSQVDGLADALADAEDHADEAAAQALADAKEYVTNAVGALDYADTAVSGQFVTRVTEVDGVIAVERAAITMADVTDLNTTIEAINTEIDTKQDALTFTSAPNSTDNRVATEQFVVESVADLNGAMHFVGEMDEVPTDNSQYAAGDVILVGVEEYVFDGNTWHCLGNESIYMLKADAATQHEALQTAIDEGLAELESSKQDNLVFSGDYSASNPVMTDSAVDALIEDAVGALDYADAAVSGQFVTAVSEADGIIAVTRAALKASDIPTIAQSQVDGLADALDAAETAGVEAADAALTSAKEYTANAIAALDYTDAAVDKQVVTAVSETDGVIAVTRETLSDLAWSGHVKDLVQDDYILVFDCGTATTVI